MSEYEDRHPEQVRTIEYLINNPEEITLEDLERESSFFNNFSRKIQGRDHATPSDSEVSRKLAEAIKSLVEGTDFDLTNSIE